MNKIEKTDTLSKILSGRSFTVDVFQREYRWGKKQVEQLLDDLQNCFEKYYDPNHHDSTAKVAEYGFYFLGHILCVSDSTSASFKIVDGQQRLTTLTLLLIYLNNLQKEQVKDGDAIIQFNDMICHDHFGKNIFNIKVEEREACFQALYNNNLNYKPVNESEETMLRRYEDIKELFPDELKREALPFFIYWLKDKVLLLEVDTLDNKDAYTIFVTMNDRGLSLNSSEMMKGFVTRKVTAEDQGTVNHKWQENINKIKKASNLDTSGMLNTEDVEFISVWLRANYAETLREGKRGSKDEDFELLGEKFHIWVRDNAKRRMKLSKSKDYENFVKEEMTRVTDLYLRIKRYTETLTPGYEEVFYNADRDLNYQTMLIIAAVANCDNEDVINRKIQMVSKFVDDFASIRIFNFKKAGWNSNKYFLFRVMKEIRNQDCKTVGMVLVRALRRMDVGFDGITKFSLNQFSKRYMLHILARFTAYVNVRMGNSSQFNTYVDRKTKGNTYDIEHILPDDYDSYQDEFDDIDDFQESRQKLGNLIILTRDKNRSYQDMNYTDKVNQYSGDNILAQTLNEIAYQKNPQFLPLVEEYGFAPISKFTKASIDERTRIYLQLAGDIWDFDAIKELAGGWEDDAEKEFFKDDNASEFIVEYRGRSWPDALKYGFLSANPDGKGKSLRNVHEGDVVYCHVAKYGFVGIGICKASAVPMKSFMVHMDGVEKPITEVPWELPEYKDKLDVDKEIFIRVEWKDCVENLEDGYWKKGMKSLPMVAYKLSDQSTCKKVRERFGYKD